MVKGSKELPAVKCILIIYFYINSQFYIAAAVSATASSIVLPAATRAADERVKELAKSDVLIA